MQGYDPYQIKSKLVNYIVNYFLLPLSPLTKEGFKVYESLEPYN